MPAWSTSANRTGKVWAKAGMARGARLAGLAPHLGVLVEPGLQALRRDLDDDVLVAEQRLAAQPRLRAHIEGQVEPVALRVVHLGQRVAALQHPHVTGRA